MKTASSLVLPVAMYPFVKLLDSLMAIRQYCPECVSTASCQYTMMRVEVDSTLWLALTEDRNDRS